MIAYKPSASNRPKLRLLMGSRLIQAWNRTRLVATLMFQLWASLALRIMSAPRLLPALRSRAMAQRTRRYALALLDL